MSEPTPTDRTAAGSGPRARELIAIAFFIGLAALEIAHGIGRLSTARRRSHEELLGTTIERAQDDLVANLAVLVEGPEDHARYLAAMPILEDFRADMIDDLGTELPDSPHRDELEKHFLSYLLAYRTIDRLRVISPSGREWVRCERVGTDGGVCAIPPRALRRESASSILDTAAALAEGGAGRTRLLVDGDRVEVPPSDRQIFHCVVAIRDGDDDPGRARALVVVTVYAAPILAAVRSFAPIDGVEAALVDGTGEYLAHSRRFHERAGAGDLRVDHPNVAAFILAGSERLHVDDTYYLSRAVDVRNGWRLITMIPETALDNASGGLRRESQRIIATVVGITLLIAIAALFFVRLGRRAIALEERARQEELEERLLISERLGALGLITAGVAHEINNPLAGIENYLTLLGRDALDPAKRAEYLEQVRHGFGRIRAIANDLSSASRGSGGSAEVDLRGVVDRALSLGRYDPHFRGIEVEVTGPEGAWRVRGDAGRLEQVFLNLFLNGARAMAGEGTLRVHASRSEGSVGGMLELAIDDEGPGISPEHLERLFEPFFTTEDEGLGLGLAISRGIIVAHGGSIEVENRAEGGARFRVRLAAIEGETDANPTSE